MEVGVGVGVGVSVGRGCKVQEGRGVRVAVDEGVGERLGEAVAVRVSGTGVEKAPAVPGESMIVSAAARINSITIPSTTAGKIQEGFDWLTDI